MLFAQVREDPSIELHVASLLTTTASASAPAPAPAPALKILCIASGGCTALTLAATYPNAKITAIDMSPAQIYLCELKKALCINYEIEQILHMYQTSGDLALKLGTLQALYDKKEISAACYNYWMGNQSMLYEGINQCGAFEHLFEEVAKTGNFDKVFGRKNLISVFGENAVNHSTNREFSQHFREVINKYKEYYGEREIDARQNYFYYQIAYNRYHPLSLPKYLEEDSRAAIKSASASASANIKFIIGSFIDHLRDSADKSYDIIQTSNITDWLTLDEICTLLCELGRVCTEGGYVVMRRLNSDMSLAAILAVMSTTPFIAVSLPVEDTTFFYREVVCLLRISSNKTGNRV